MEFRIIIPHCAAWGFLSLLDTATLPVVIGEMTRGLEYHFSVGSGLIRVDVEVKSGLSLLTGAKKEKKRE
jgi:hypothetical protein